jgi:hypothetical protein
MPVLNLVLRLEVTRCSFAARIDQRVNFRRSVELGFRHVRFAVAGTFTLGRVGMWRGSSRFCIAVAVPFV